MQPVDLLASKEVDTAVFDTQRDDSPNNQLSSFEYSQRAKIDAPAIIHNSQEELLKRLSTKSRGSRRSRGSAAK